MNDVISAAAFPRVKEYLDSLPEGWASYPSYEAKGALLIGCLEGKSLNPAPGLPQELLRVLQQPPLPSEWMSEVSYCATNVAIADQWKLDNAAFRQFWYEVMSDLAKSKIYQVLFGFVTPDTLLGAAARYWSRFHRGVGLRALPRGNEGILYTVTWPNGLIPELIAHGFAGVFQRVAELSKRGSPHIDLVQFGTTGAAYRLTR